MPEDSYMRFLGLGFMALSGVLIGFGCSSDPSAPPADNFFGSGAATGTTDASGGNSGTTIDSSSTGGTGGISVGSGGQSGSSGSAGSPLIDASIPDVTFSYDAPVTEEDACASATAEAQPLPLDMYVILDKSGSMKPDCSIGSSVDSKWCRAINALYQFFADSSSAGMGVALQYFSGTACSALTIPSVPPNILPNHLSTLQASLNSAVPGGNTPTSAAVNGIVGYTNANQQPGRTMIGILITDGDPTECDTNISNLNTTLTNHFNSTGIATYVIGMDGASFQNLENMAQGAGASPHNNYCGTLPAPCHFYNVGNGNSQVFIDTLKQIQQNAISCTFNMPATDAGIIDLNQVSVVYTPNGTGTPQTFQKVSDATQCGNLEGWHFDNNFNPTTIHLCPAACDKVSADQTAKVNIELGCLGA